MAATASYMPKLAWTISCLLVAVAILVCTLWAYSRDRRVSSEQSALESFYMIVISKRYVNQGIKQGEINPDRLEEVFRSDFPRGIARKRGFWKVQYFVYEGEGKYFFVFARDRDRLKIVTYGWINEEEGRRW